MGGDGQEESDHQPPPTARICQDAVPQWGPADPAGHQSCPQAPRTTLPVPSPEVPSLTFHVLQDGVQLVNAPLEHEAELEAKQVSASPWMRVSKPLTGLGGQGH